MSNDRYFTLGRLPQFDERSRDYKVRTLLDQLELPARKPISKLWTPGPTLNQSNSPACVGFSFTHRLMSDPIRNMGLNNTTALALYKMAQLYDEWPGTNYEGSSVLGGVKAAQHQGYVGSYHWCGAGSGTPIEDVMDSIGYIGPVNLGIPWADSMFQPRHSGLLEVDVTRIAGGHAICAVGQMLSVSLPGETKKLDVIELQQSWGISWGVRGGFCYIKPEDLEALLKMQGEALVIVQEHLVRRR